MANIQRHPVRDPKVRAALEAVRKRNGGILPPAAVVDAARHENNALHRFFTWDDGAAAEAWRVHQARNLIRMVVTMIPNTETESDMYVSMQADREEEGGGYRTLVEVLSDEEQRERLLAEAMEELAAFRRKYSRLKELAAVFAALDEVRAAAK